MSVTKDRSELYEDLGPGDRIAVNRAFDAVVAMFCDSGINTTGDDAAEVLVGAIARYLEDSREPAI